MQTSVLTLVRDRPVQLGHFLQGLARQRGADFELVIAAMQSRPLDLDGGHEFPIRVVQVPGDELPLAQARNAAAAAARGEQLIFLDVDCIALPELVATYALALETDDRCLMGEVRYLGRDEASQASDYAALWGTAMPHPARPQLPDAGLVPEADASALWGLSFGLRRARFLAAGGFDPAYRGYGGEETDFAQRLAAIDTDFAWLAGARALHQWHPIARPPLDHFQAIIANAQRFHARWGRWCLEYWLDQFARAGLIRWRLEDATVEIIREPTAAERQAAKQCGHERRF